MTEKNPILVPPIDYDYELVVRRIDELLAEESSDLWRDAGEVIERLVPGISPFDRREAIFEILAPIRKVFADEFA